LYHSLQVDGAVGLSAKEMSQSSPEVELGGEHQAKAIRAIWPKPNASGMARALRLLESPARYARY
jgi:hypothetical protein